MPDSPIRITEGRHIPHYRMFSFNVIIAIGLFLTSMDTVKTRKVKVSSVTIDRSNSNLTHQVRNIR